MLKILSENKIEKKHIDLKNQNTRNVYEKDKNESDGELTSEKDELSINVQTTKRHKSEGSNIR